MGQEPVLLWTYLSQLKTFEFYTFRGISRINVYSGHGIQIQKF